MARLHLIPECHAETAMVRHIFKGNEDILNHGSNIQEVCKILKKEDIEGYVNIGFVDNDKKNVPSYFSEFEAIEEIPSVIFKKHPNTNDYLFVAKPAIETFILTQVTELELTLSYFNFPNNFKEFMHKMKKSLIENNTDYLNLLAKIDTDNPSGIVFIKNHLSELRAL